MRPGTHELKASNNNNNTKANLVIVAKTKKEKRNTLFGKREKGEITSKTFEEQLMITVLKLKVSSISRYYQEMHKN